MHCSIWKRFLIWEQTPNICLVSDILAMEEEQEEEEGNPCMELLMLHNKTNGEELDVMEYLAKCSGPSRVPGYKLSEPSPIIGYPCHWLTDSLTHSCLVDLTDVTLEFEDANSNLLMLLVLLMLGNVLTTMVEILKLSMTELCLIF